MSQTAKDPPLTTGPVSNGTSEFKVNAAKQATARKAEARRREAPPPLDLTPDDQVIVQKRQDWRVKVARFCLDYYEGAEPGKLGEGRARTDPRELRARFERISDQIRRDLPTLLMTGLTVHELEAVRHSVNYFLEEIVRHVRKALADRYGTKRPLEEADPEEIERLVKESIQGSTDTLLIFVEDIVRLADFEIEVGSQRERIRLLLGGDRRLSGLGNNETIMTSSIPELWRSLGDFASVYSYLREYLPPLLDKASPYPELEEELKGANEQLQVLVRERVDPFERRVEHKRHQDRVFEELETKLDGLWRSATQILEMRVGPLVRQAGGSGSAPTVGEVKNLEGALRGLDLQLDGLPAKVVLPPPQTAMDSRGEGKENGLGELDVCLVQVRAELPGLRQMAILGLGEDDDALDSVDLGELLAEVDDRLKSMQRLLESALLELQKCRNTRVRALREHYCTLMGELRTFLQTSFAHIAAKDPRSTESSYHFFLREFSHEAHQAIMLLKEIRELEVFINTLGTFNISGLPLNPENLARILRVLFVDKDDEKKRIPSGEGWKVMATFLDKLKDELVPRLQRVCALDGIRYEDKNFLQEWAMDLTKNCTLCLAQHEIGYTLLQEMGRLRDDPESAAARQSHLHIVTTKTCKAMQQSLTEITMTLTASIPYVGIMRGGVERRASIFFHRQQKLLENPAISENEPNSPFFHEDLSRPPE